MRSAALAEWILRRVTTKVRATTIVGDLVESRASSIQFWLSVAGVVLMSSWRWVLATVLAFCTGMWALGILQVVVFGINSAHPVPSRWEHSLGLVSGVGMILCFLAPYLLVRYGFRDKAAQFASGAAAICAVVCFFWWQLWVLAICGIVSVAGTAVWLFENERRKPVLATALAIVTGYIAAMGMFYFDFLYTRFLVPEMLIGDAEMAAHPSLRWAGNLSLITAVMVTFAACSWLHDLFIHHDVDSEEAAISDRTLD